VKEQLKKILIISIVPASMVMSIAAQQHYFDFQTVAPESLNINSAILQEHGDELFRRGTQAYMVV